MKEIKAIIQEFMLPKVVEALPMASGVSWPTVSRVGGFGKYGTEEELSETSPKIKLEIVVPAVHVDNLIELIRSHAHTDRPGQDQHGGERRERYLADGRR